MKRFIVLLLSVLVLSGCSILSHLSELLTLKDLSADEATMDKIVEKQDARFEALMKAVESGDIHQYKKKNSVVKKFGDPILIEEVTRDNQVLAVWIYRYSVKFFNSPKVYLTFDPDGNLIESKFEKGSDPSPEASTPKN